MADDGDGVAAAGVAAAGVAAGRLVDPGVDIGVELAVEGRANDEDGGELAGVDEPGRPDDEHAAASTAVATRELSPRTTRIRLGSHSRVSGPVSHGH